MSADRLHKLLLLLSSPHPGEVAAAAHAIGNLLAAEKRDWHWLAARLDARPAGPRPPPLPDSKPWQGADACDDHRAAARWLIVNAGHRLRAKERDFISTMSDWSGEPTERQAAWLSDLCRRCGCPL